MFWKIFAWVNLIISLPIFATAVFSDISTLRLVDIVVGVVNDIPLMVVPLLFAYKNYDVKYFSNVIFLKAILVFTILYNATHIVNDLVKYTLTSIPGFLFDMFFYALIILSIISFVLYIMEKYKIPFHRVFLK
ncbi:MAG: hypothetical protein Q7S11_03400 [bacterium]|nr:hypothetical protein [bacterium]